MKSIYIFILTFTIFTGCTESNSFNSSSNTNTDLNSSSNTNTDLNSSSNLSDISFDKKIHLFLDNQNCDQLIIRHLQSGQMNTCYDFSLLSAKYVSYTVTADLVDLNNIKPRPRFTPDLELLKKYRTQYSDYTHSGFDRGHLAPDASFDYNEDDLITVSRNPNGLQPLG